MKATLPPIQNLIVIGSVGVSLIGGTVLAYQFGAFEREPIDSGQPIMESRELPYRDYTFPASSQSSSVSTEGITVFIPTEWNYAFEARPESKLVVLHARKPLTISGTTLPETARMVVTFMPAWGDGSDDDVYALQNFKAGDTVWRYTIDEKLGNIRPGLNLYQIQAIDAAGRTLDEKQLLVGMDQRDPAPLGSGESTLLDVEWREPVKMTIVDIYRQATDSKRYIRHATIKRRYEDHTYCTLGEDFSTAPKLMSLDGSGLSDEILYEVGIVRSGEYAGAKVYAHEEEFSCMMTTNFVEHFLLKADGGFLRLQGSSTTALTEKMPEDGTSTIDAGGPVTIALAGGKTTLAPCKGNECGLFSMYSRAVHKEVPELSNAERTVYTGTDGCFNVPRNDGFLQEYELSHSRTIRWNDGSTTDATSYVSGTHYGCGVADRCHWVASGIPDDITLTGKTADGLEVYEENITPEDLAAMKTGTPNSDFSFEGISSLHDLYWALPRYDEANIPTPEAFMKNHPAFYVKDPLGRYLFYRAEQYGPMVECGKPVIYLYPEQEQDVSVQVEPTGGFTVTDPQYGENGWFVRATPTSDIYNYANGKTYPYLFWEGHGADYERPERGFVVAQAEVPQLLREKLMALGLNEKESDDFREFWEPKLMQSPYVFVTFVDQPTFDTIAPLTVTPAPDTVIRVFMDYVPLENPIGVEPLPITTPERRGFTVVEWGGALHSNDAACPGVVLLQ